MKKILLVAIISVLSGCVSFTSSNTPKVDIIQGIGSRPNVLLKVNTFSTTNGTVASWKQFELNRKLGRKLKQTFNESGMFGEVSESVKNPDYKLDVVVKDTYTECAACNILNIVTLSIIPSWANEKFYYQAHLVNTKTNKNTSFDYYETSKEVRQLFMLFAYPFMYNAEDKLHKNVFNNLVLDVAKEVSK